MIMDKRLSLLVLLAIMFLIGQASANTYYVNNSWPGASDTNDGLADMNTSAWLTIQKAANTLVAGDTVRVQAGTYAETVSPINSGNFTHWIIYVGDNYPFINPPSTEAFSIINKDYINITGFNATSSGAGGIDTYNIWYSSNIILKDLIGYGGYRIIHVYENDDVRPSSFITIDNATVWGSQWSGISINYHEPELTNVNGSLYPNNNITIKNSWVHDIGEHNGIDIHTYAKDIVLENNLVENITTGSQGAQTGIYIHNNNIENIIVSNNTLKNNYKGMGVIGVQNSTFINNQIIGTVIANPIYIQTEVSYKKNNNTNLTFNSNMIIGEAPVGYGAFGFKFVQAGTITDNVTLINNTVYSPTVWGAVQFETSGIYNVTIRNENPDGQLFTVAKYTTTDLSGTVLEYTDGRIFTENDVQNTPYWYQSRSNISITGEQQRAPPETYTVFNSTLNTTGNITVSSFNTTYMILNYYTQNVTRTNFTISELDSPSNLDITINNPASATTNYSLYYWNGTVILANQSGASTVFDSNLAAGTYYIEEGYTAPTPPGTCSGFQSGTTIFSGNCTSISQLNASVNNVSVLQNLGSNEWFLNANLTINSSQTFNINDSDVSWLKINSTDVSSANASRINVSGTLYINNTKITSWNVTTSDLAVMKNVIFDTTIGRAYIYNSGTDSHIYIDNSNISGLGGHCSGMTAGISLCNGVTFITTDGNSITDSTLIDNYVIFSQQSATNTTISNNTISSKYGGLWYTTDYIKVLNNNIIYSPNSAYNDIRFAAVSSVGGDYATITGNDINQTSKQIYSCALRLYSSSNNNIIDNVTLNSNGNSALYLTNANYNIISNYTITKKDPFDTSQAPIQLELGVQNNNIFRDGNVNATGSQRAFVMSGNNTLLINSSIINSFGGTSALQFFGGNNLTIIDTVIDDTNNTIARDFEHSSDNGTAYIYDTFPDDMKVTVPTGILNLVNSSNNPIKILTNYSQHYPSNSTLSFVGTNVSSGNIVTYPNLSVFATNSTIQVNDADGANFTNTNNAGTVSTVNYSNVTDEWIYYLNKDNSETITSAVANEGKVSFSGLSLADGIYLISNNSVTSIQAQIQVIWWE